ncbi:MAG: LysM peptidoglycan-binding domain-containing protein, partial [Verrucomicrobiota bacterium]
MRPLITVTAVVILHLCVLAVLVGVNGCRSTSGHEVDSPAHLAAHAGGLRRAQLPTKVGAAPVPSAPAAPAVAAHRLAEPVIATPPPSALVGMATVAPGETIAVMKGETLFAIARRQGVSVAQLASANGL